MKTLGRTMLCKGKWWWDSRSVSRPNGSNKPELFKSSPCSFLPFPFPNNSNSRNNMQQFNVVVLGGELHFFTLCEQKCWLHLPSRRCRQVRPHRQVTIVSGQCLYFEHDLAVRFIRDEFLETYDPTIEGTWPNPPVFFHSPPDRRIPAPYQSRWRTDFCGFVRRHTFTLYLSLFAHYSLKSLIPLVLISSHRCTRFTLRCEVTDTS